MFVWKASSMSWSFAILRDAAILNIPSQNAYDEELRMSRWKYQFSYRVRNKSGVVFYIWRGCVNIYPFYMKLVGIIEQTKF